MANSREILHERLSSFAPNVYFQAPASLMIKYPSIMYNKTGKSRRFGNNGVYLSKQEYQLTVITRDPDSDVADRLEEAFEYCRINQYYVVDNLHHTTLSLYY